MCEHASPFDILKKQTFKTNPRKDCTMFSNMFPEEWRYRNFARVGLAAMLFAMVAFFLHAHLRHVDALVGWSPGYATFLVALIFLGGFVEVLLAIVLTCAEVVWLLWQDWRLARKSAAS